MKSIVITPKDDRELKFVSELLKKLGINSRVLSEEEQEDVGMSILMGEVDRSSKVSKAEIIKKLNS
jgi:intein/homing endonuclease